MTPETRDAVVAELQAAAEAIRTSPELVCACIDTAEPFMMPNVLTAEYLEARAERIAVGLPPDPAVRS